MKELLAALLLLLPAALAVPSLAQTPTPPFRPASVPLITHDPYFSVWSGTDKLTDDWTRHWTGSIMGMCGMARIDGKPYRFAGPAPADVPALPQVAVHVTATRTVYQFEGAGIKLSVTFTSPLLPRDLDVLSRPITYVTWEATSADGTKHSVKLYLDCTGEWVVNQPSQNVVWQRGSAGPLTTLRIGSATQRILNRAGDNLRIDWGYLYMAAATAAGTQACAASDKACRTGFSESGRLPSQDDTTQPRAANDNWPVLAFSMDLGQVGPSKKQAQILLGYDDMYSIQLMHQNLKAWWCRNGQTIQQALEAAHTDYGAINLRCVAFDTALHKDLVKAGGPEYAQLCELAYRQCLNGHKLVAATDGRPMLFPKECFSNGCISTVDVLYPSSPLALLFNTDLVKALLNPVMDYAASDHWRFPFAPHDLGTYPLANGQVYGGGERTETDQMPVEESGNMIVMLDAMARIDGTAEYAAKYWPQIEKWAAYLKEKGMDPENQLCTDDFAGHLAHNTNLSLKAIVALRCYANLCKMLGKTALSAEYEALTKQMAAHWAEMAHDGDHYKLAFDRSGTWSQKYNMVWDKVFNMKLFDPAIAATETSYYLAHQNEFGLPLDNRKTYTKSDWLTWTATMAGTDEQFRTLIHPLYMFQTSTPSRNPFSDWYDTISSKQVGFQNRTVIGGLFIKMLSDPAMRMRWAKGKVY